MSSNPSSVGIVVLGSNAFFLILFVVSGVHLFDSFPLSESSLVSMARR